MAEGTIVLTMGQTSPMQATDHADKKKSQYRKGSTEGSTVQATQVHPKLLTAGPAGPAWPLDPGAPISG